MSDMNLARKQVKIWAEDVERYELAVLGSFAAGDAVYTKDIDELQSAAYSLGWAACVYGGNNASFMEEDNALNYVITYQLAYLLQKGIPEYLSSEMYYTGDFCQVSGVIYQSLQNNNQSNAPASSPAYWKECNFMDMASDAEASAGVITNKAVNPKQLAAGLALKQDLITSSNMLNADLVNDASSTHKFATAAQLTQISTNSTNIQTNTADIAGLQTQIDALAAASDVTDIVGTYAELQAYDTSTLQNNSIIKVLQDSTHNNETTYYRWEITSGTGAWVLIGEEGPYYTIAAADAQFVPKTAEINGHILSGDIVITASDITAGTLSAGVLPVSGVTAGSYTNASITVDAKGRVTSASNGSTSAVNWGTIAGTLSSQTDLQNALNAKAPLTQPINTLSTSGTISLTDNSVNSITPSGAVTFSLPSVSDNTKFHQILVQVNLSSVVSITLGTSYYFNKEAPDMSEAGVYNLIYEYDKAKAWWVCGAISKGQAS